MSGIIGTIHVAAATVGASEVTTVRASRQSSTTVATIITPASGKRVRIISVNMSILDGANMEAEIYFGDGANIATTPANAIWDYSMRRKTDNAFALVSDSFGWPDGGGPVGDVDEVVSHRAGISVSTTVYTIIHFREE